MITSKLRASLLGDLFAGLAVTACSKKKEPPPAAAPPAVSDAGAVTAAAPDQPAAPARSAPAWTRGTARISLLCGQGEEVTGSYGDALAKGRKAAKQKGWLAAVAAFQQALRDKPDDAAALSELSVALLQVGDAGEALLAGELAAKQSKDAKAQAASLYNAGRAAEALGQLDKARQHYQASLALRDNEAIRSRMQAMTAPQPKLLPSEKAMTACEGQATPQAVCDCLVENAAKWGKSYGVTETASCALVEKKGGERGAILSVMTKEPVPEQLVPGNVLVLAAKRGDKWFAVQPLQSSDEIDLTVTPRAGDDASADRYEELPLPDGTLFWVETSRSAMETALGETQSEGEANLHLCVLPDDAAKAPFCSGVKLGAWDLTFEPERGDDPAKCEDRLVSTYRAVLDSSGVGSLIFDGGHDELKQIGRFRVKLAP